jgi:hypothetical protein
LTQGKPGERAKDKSQSAGKADAWPTLKEITFRLKRNQFYVQINIKYVRYRTYGYESFCGRAGSPAGRPGWGAWNDWQNGTLQMLTSAASFATQAARAFWEVKS